MKPQKTKTKFVVLSTQDPLFPFPCYFAEKDEERAYTFSIEEARMVKEECQGDALIIDITNKKVVE